MGFYVNSSRAHHFERRQWSPCCPQKRIVQHKNSTYSSDTARNAPHGNYGTNVAIRIMRLDRRNCCFCFALVHIVECLCGLAYDGYILLSDDLWVS